MTKPPGCCRPWFRLRNIVLAVLLLFVVWAGWWVRWAMTVVPNPTVDYAAELEQLSAAAQPQGEDAWPILRDQLAMLGQLEAAFPKEDRPFEHSGGFDPMVVTGPDASPEAVAIVLEADQWLLDHHVYAQLDRVARCPRMVRPLIGQEGPLVEVLLPDLAQARQLAKWRIASMHLAFKDGRIDDAVDAFEQTMAIARLYTHQATLIDALVGHAIFALAWQQFNLELTDHQLVPDTLRRVLAILLEQAQPAPMSLAIEGERRFFLDTVQRSYSDDGTGDGYLLVGEIGVGGLVGGARGIDDEPRQNRLMNLIGPFFASRREMLLEGNKTYDSFIDMTEMNRTERAAASQQFEQDLWNLGFGFELLQLLIPAIGKGIDQIDLTVMGMRGTQLLVAIELYRAQHGEYPPTLDALAPGILPAIDPDPISGQPFVYRLLDDDPHGRQFLLYSRGADGADNGGAFPPANRFAALQKATADGADFVFNVPRDAAPRD